MSLLVLVMALAANVSGVHFISKAACSGESVVLLTSSLLNIDWTSISIHFQDNLIATWIKSDSELTETVKGKMFLDRGGDIRVLNTTTSDEGIYTFALEAIAGNTAITTYRVQLSIHVAPSVKCKPEIRRVDKLLHASLIGADCGKPNASVQFVKFSDISYESDTVAKLNDGREAGIYIACVETPALFCARNSNPFDFCSYFTIHENTSKVILHSGLLPENLLLIIVLLMVLAVLTLQSIQIYLKFRKRRYNRKYPRHEATEQRTCDVHSAFQPRHYQPQATQHNEIDHELESVIPLTTISSTL